MTHLDDLEGLYQRHFLDPTDGFAAYALALALKRVDDPLAAREVCIRTLALAQPSEAEVSLRQLLFSLPSVGTTRSWSVVGEFPLACEDAAAGQAKLFLLPDAACSGGPSALWLASKPRQGILELLSGTPVTNQQPWIPFYWDAFGLKELVVGVNSWAAVGASGGAYVWVGHGAFERSRVRFDGGFVAVCATSQPGDWLLVDRDWSGLTVVSLDPDQMKENVARVTRSQSWSVGGRVCRATLTPTKQILAVNLDRGLTLYDAFGAREAPLMQIEDSLWMSWRTNLSRAGDRAFNLNVWERAGEQVWWWLSLPDQQRYRFVTKLPDLRGWCTCPNLQTLAFWTHSGSLHFWDIEAASSLCELYIAQDPQDPLQIDHLTFDPQMRFALATSWHKKKALLLA